MGTATRDNHGHSDQIYHGHSDQRQAWSQQLEALTLGVPAAAAAVARALCPVDWLRLQRWGCALHLAPLVAAGVVQGTEPAFVLGVVLAGAAAEEERTHTQRGRGGPSACAFIPLQTLRGEGWVDTQLQQSQTSGSVCFYEIWIDGSSVHDRPREKESNSGCFRVRSERTATPLSTAVQPVFAESGACFRHTVFLKSSVFLKQCRLQAQAGPASIPNRRPDARPLHIDTHTHGREGSA